MIRLDLNDVQDHNPREILAAAPDALALALGAHLTAPHPFADAVARAPLRTAAIAAGLILAPRRSGETEAAVLGRGLWTTAFSGAIAAGLQAAARRRFDAQAAHLAAVGTVEVKRLGVFEAVGALDLSAPLSDVGDGIEYKVASGSLRDGEEIKLSSLGRIIGLTREAIINDDHELIEDAISATGVAAARHEARLIAAALEGNGNLTDGLAVFDAAFGNVSAAAFDAAGLAAAMSALRTQLAADGQALDAVAVSLIVAPGLEFTARQLAYQAGLPLAVLVLPGLAAGRFYLTASPEVARNIAVGRLEGATHPLNVEGLKPPLNFDGTAIRIRIDTTAAMLGRVGIVKGGA